MPSPRRHWSISAAPGGTRASSALWPWRIFDESRRDGPTTPVLLPPGLFIATIVASGAPWGSQHLARRRELQARGHGLVCGGLQQTHIGRVGRGIRDLHLRAHGHLGGAV